MEKQLALRRWHALQENLPIMPHFTPIAADARGSTFGACGIRISGNPQFVDAVLSRLKDILAAESGATRLSLSRQTVKPVAIRDSVKKWTNADTDAETCYIQIRERTAKTRQRKAREATAPLFAEGADATEPNTPPTPTAKTAKAKIKAPPTEPPPEDEPEPRKGVHIGDDGELSLW